MVNDIFLDKGILLVDYDSISDKLYFNLWNVLYV